MNFAKDWAIIAPNALTPLGIEIAKHFVAAGGSLLLVMPTRDAATWQALVQELERMKQPRASIRFIPIESTRPDIYEGMFIWARSQFGLGSPMSRTFLFWEDPENDKMPTMTRLNIGLAFKRMFQFNAGAIFAGVGDGDNFSHVLGPLTECRDPLYLAASLFDPDKPPTDHEHARCLVDLAARMKPGKSAGMTLVVSVPVLQ